MKLEGLHLDRYILGRLLGRGGMGEVYLAEDTNIHRHVAIKIVRLEATSYPHSESSRMATDRSQREMKAITMLDHPHILPLFDYGEKEVDEDIFAYIVMPYREEGSLAHWLRKRESEALLSPESVVFCMKQASEALQHAHDRGIIHQDVKPSNFLVRSKAETPDHPDLFLADFGIAKFMSATSSTNLNVLGTPMYMAPEQWEGHAVPATDQYALAIMTYELLVGQVPLQGSIAQLMYQHMHVIPTLPSTIKPDLPPSIDTILLAALAKDPTERFPSVTAFVHALQQAIQGGNPRLLLHKKENLNHLHNMELKEQSESVIPDSNVKVEEGAENVIIEVALETEDIPAGLVSDHETEDIPWKNIIHTNTGSDQKSDKLKIKEGALEPKPIESVPMRETASQPDDQHHIADIPQSQQGEQEPVQQKDARHNLAGIPSPIAIKGQATQLAGSLRASNSIHSKLMGDKLAAKPGFKRSKTWLLATVACITIIASSIGFFYRVGQPIRSNSVQITNTTPNRQNTPVTAINQNQRAGSDASAQNSTANTSQSKTQGINQASDVHNTAQINSQTQQQVNTQDQAQQQTNAQATAQAQQQAQQQANAQAQQQAQQQANAQATAQAQLQAQQQANAQATAQAQQQAQQQANAQATAQAQLQAQQQANAQATAQAQQQANAQATANAVVPFQVTSVSVSASPDPVRGLCSSTTNITYTVYITVPANTNGGTVSYYVYLNSTTYGPYGLSFPAGQTNGSYSFTSMIQLNYPANPSPAFYAVVTNPNSMTSNTVQPNNSCYYT